MRLPRREAWHYQREMRSCLCAALLLALMGAGAVAAPNGEAKPAAANATVLQTGKAALEDGLYDLAEKQLRIYLATAKRGSADAEEATILLSRALYGLEKYQEILRLLPTSRPGAHSLWRGAAYCGLKDYDNALKELSAAAKDTETGESAVNTARLVARCYLGKGQTNDALKVFGSIERRFHDSPQAADNLLDWARTLRLAGNDASAQGVFELLGTRLPNTAAGREGRQLLGRMHIDAKRWADAETILQPLANDEAILASDRARAWLSLAEVHEAQKKLHAATNAVLAAMSLVQNGEARRASEASYGRLLLKLGKLDEGVRILKGFIASDPKDSIADDLQLRIADAFLGAGNAEQAAAEYQYYLDTFAAEQGKARALVGRGWALSSLATPAYAEAAQAFQKAHDLSKDPVEQAKCLFKVADSHFNNNQHKLAAETYAKLIAAFPRSALVPQARFQIAESSAHDERIDEAKQLFAALAKDYPDDFYSHSAIIRVAELKRDEGQLLAALADYESMIESHTNSPLYVNAVHGHGLISYRLLKFEAALADFTKVVEIAEKSEFAEQAFYMRGWCYQIMGRETEALKTCRDFVAQFGSSKWAADVLFWIGEYEFNRGNYAEAEKQFMIVAARYPSDVAAEKALLWAGKSATKQKEYLKATEHYVALAEKYAGSERLAEARYYQGDALSELAQFSSAILIFDEVIKKYPKSYLVELAWGRKGDCQFALGRNEPGRYDSAIRSYRVVIDSEKASSDLKLQAQYKVGRCLQKLERLNEAFEQYYAKVVCVYLDDIAKGIHHNSASDVWFTRAAFDGVEILESQEKWKQAIRLLRRVTDSGVPAAKEAQDRVNKIRLEHWILFY